MFSFSNADRVGLTIDQSGIRYAKVKNKKGWEIERCGFLPFEQGHILDDQFTALDELRDSIHSWVKAEKLLGATVTVAVPTSQVIIRKLKFDAANARELKQLVELEVETALHLPFETPVYDFIQTGLEDGKQQVLVYASPLKWIQQCMQLLEGAGLKLRQADLASFALARAVQQKLQTSLESTMLIHLDKANIEIYMFHNGYPVFMRVMNEYEQYAIGEDGLAPEVVASMNAEIARLLNFYQYSIHEGESRITHTVITGSLKGRDRFIEAFCDLNAEMRVESVVFDDLTPSAQGVKGDDFRIPFGLAIRDNKPDVINLLPERLVRSKSLPIRLVIAGLIWVIGVAAIFIMYGWNAASIDDKKRQAEALAQSNALLEAELTNLNNQSSSNADPEAVIQAIVQNRQDAVQVLDYLHDQLPVGALLQTLEYAKPGSVALTVKFADMQHIADYLTALRTFEYSGGAALQGYSGTGEEWTARYEMKWKDEAEKQDNGEEVPAANESE
ncbi:hypothetical protein D3P08_07275 [Paenibacillus nanensis]|uniref:Fimbrial assembly protein n=1 Tax=Paenibacillus nanensis TaxID=393251 RepID=A0A3A1V2S4_9BACL|nr:pilus assembly protein PilM [Paenibacillus nanensis]RIX54046.1 hypothetical protein D3P08_07275 [Paenibacillus nanensis]